MLSEMMRLGLVTRSSAGMISLIRNTPALPPSTVSTIGAITPWVNFVSDAGSSTNATGMVSKAHQIKIYFDSISEAMAAVRELDLRQRTFVAGIQQLGTRNKPRGSHEVTVSVAVATTRPSRSTRKKRK